MNTPFQPDLQINRRQAMQRKAEKKAGRPVPPTNYDDVPLMRRGLFATTRIVDRVETFAAANNRKVLYGFPVNFFNLRQLPYVDLMATRAADFGKFRLDIDEYLLRYFVGHYNPLGNFACAFAMKDALATMLDPKPPGLFAQADTGTRVTDVRNGGRIRSVVYVPECSRFQDPTFMINYGM